MVTGTLAEVDDHMNMYIDNAVWTPVEGPPQVMLLWLATASAVVAAAPALAPAPAPTRRQDGHLQQ
jgi:small nuclear ribonucleoprotein (snRNP)-like protein